MDIYIYIFYWLTLKKRIGQQTADAGRGQLGAVACATATACLLVSVRSPAVAAGHSFRYSRAKVRPFVPAVRCLVSSEFTDRWSRTSRSETFRALPKKNSHVVILTTASATVAVPPSGRRSLLPSLGLATLLQSTRHEKTVTVRAPAMMRSSVHTSPPRPAGFLGRRSKRRNDRTGTGLEACNAKTPLYNTMFVK
jgi:hypothetical protein